MRSLSTPHLLNAPLVEWELPHDRPELFLIIDGDRRVVVTLEIPYELRLVLPHQQFRILITAR